MSTRYVVEDGAVTATASARGLTYDAAWSRVMLRRLQARARPDLLALLLIAGAVAFIVGRMPIDGRGDYGQWLMTSRYYLGQDVPDYRTITALPPLIPFLLAGTRLLLPDPGTALQTFNVALLLALIGSIYFVATSVFEERLAGVFAVALAFLVSDRYLELFAFGGLLQAGALVFTLLSVGALMQAGRGTAAARAWWGLGTLSLALAALSHVGTGLLAVPVCLVVGMTSAIRSARVAERRGVQPAKRRRAMRAWLGALVIPLAVLVYWVLVLLPASGEYISNPASLNYRGPDRLIKALESYWPTIVVIGAGAGFLVIGAVRDLLHRRLGPFLVVAAWTVAAWSTLLVSIATNTSTDYPRFATPLLAPLVVAGAGGLLWIARWLTASIAARAPAARRVDLRLGLLAAVCLMAPLGFQKYAGHVRFYQPLDAAGLSSVGTWLNEELTDGQTVVAPVREGKWIEGVTGQAAVFSQPVRYTFRASERERSLVADSIVKSTMALASHEFFLKFSQGASDGKETVPRGLIIGANHRGEFLDLLRIPASQIRVLDAAGSDITSATLNDFHAVALDDGVTGDEAFVTTGWTRGAGEGAMRLNETTLVDGATHTFELIEEVAGKQPIGGIELRLWPLVGTAAASIDSTGAGADLHFRQVGLEEPHLRIDVIGGSGLLALGPDGVLVVRSETNQVHLKVTALTVGEGTADVQVLDPAKLIQTYDVAAVVLVKYDPSFETRMRRMEDLGYRQALDAGAYALLVHD